MKSLVFKFILPLSIISFLLFTKWWYVLPVDAPDSIMRGFPLPFVCEGWHTSMSLQIFITEFIIDFLIYFLFIFLIVYTVKRFWFKIKPHKFIVIILWILATFVAATAGLLATNPDNLFYAKRNFDMEVMDTGYKFVWQNFERPDYYQYHPEDKK